MFESIVTGSAVKSRARWTTAAISAVAHLVVLSVLALSALYATDTLPEPQTVMAFVVSAPPPPPPPPAPMPPPEATPKPAPRKVVRAAAPQKPQVPTPNRAAAPVEAPDGISPETGLERENSTSGAVQAGFEGGIPGGAIGGVVGGFEVTAPPPPPRTVRTTAPVRVGGEITAPRLIHRVNPEYPLIAQSALVEGVVILEATVNRKGLVDEVRVLRSHSLLEDAAVDAVKQWAYEPLMLNGDPQPFVLTVTISFSLPGR
jgi:periplasmic protein TonB